VGAEAEELDGELVGEGAEDKLAIVVLKEADGERGAGADGVDGALVGAVGGERVVVAVEDDDGAGSDEGLHGGGLLGVGADGDEALPVAAAGPGAGSVVVEARGGDLEGFDLGLGADGRLVHGGGGRDDGDGLEGAGDGWRGGCVELERKDLFDGERLRGEDAVEAFEREGTFFIKEVGDVRLPESGLPGEAGARQRTLLNPPDKLLPEGFVEVLKCHLWIVPDVSISFCKTKTRRKIAQGRRSIHNLDPKGACSLFMK
jgi:hypothetical protein